MTKSALQIARAAYQPKLPKALKGAVKVKEGEPTQSVADQEAIKALFPNTYGMPLIQFVEGEAVNMPAINVGVILSGGQAPGGHNVISGLFDGVKSLNKDSKLYGFILGPGGLVDHNYMELTSDIIDEYRNTGGFDIIGSGRTKLEMNLSTRPPVSTSFCLPVKNGWHLEQISTRIFSLVELVLYSAPQAHFTVVSLYSGCMPSFIICHLFREYILSYILTAIEILSHLALKSKRFLDRKSTRLNSSHQ